MEYPFPLEIFNEIAKQDPGAFRKLMLTSKEINLGLTPALSFYCSTPISPTEIGNYLRSSSNKCLGFTTPFQTWNSNESPHVVRRRVRIRLKGNIFRLDRDIISFPSTPISIFRDGNPEIELTNEIRNLLNRDYRLNLEIIYRILEDRKSCLKQNPNFPIRIIRNDFNIRYRSTLASLKTYPRTERSLIEYGIQVLFNLIIELKYLRGDSNWIATEREYNRLSDRDPETKLEFVTRIFSEL